MGGKDSLNGDMGDDFLNCEAGANKLLGGISNEILIGGLGEDILFSDLGDDWIDGTVLFNHITVDHEETGGRAIKDRDYLSGDDGDDTLLAGASDIVTLGIGPNNIILDAVNAGKNSNSIIAFNNRHDSISIAYSDALPTPPDVICNCISATRL